VIFKTFFIWFLDLLFPIKDLWSTSLLVNKQQLLRRCLQQSLINTYFGAEQKSIEKVDKFKSKFRKVQYY
jgi:hypothetical protein